MMFSNKRLPLWRGLVAVFLSLTLGLAALYSLASVNRGTIDGALGTQSTITTATPQEGQELRFKSDFATTDALIDAQVALGVKLGEEGTVLLKNENSSLPIKKDNPKVTLLGMGAYYPFMGGTMGSSAATGGAGQKWASRDLNAALIEAGFEVNPTMTGIYTTLGEKVTGEIAGGWGGVQKLYGYRPSGFADPYIISEPAADVYTGDGGGSANWKESLSSYSDAAIVVFSRPGSENGQYFEGTDHVVGAGAKRSLGLSDNERALIALAKECSDNVIVMINSTSTMEIEELKKSADVDSILWIGFPGSYGFLGVANILKGAACPSGYLPDTYAVDISKSPAAQNVGHIAYSNPEIIDYYSPLWGENIGGANSGGMGGAKVNAASEYIVEAEGIYAGYKYYETRYYDSVAGGLGDKAGAKSAVGATGGATSWDYKNEVSYGFGEGLSYTKFDQTLDNVTVRMADRTATATVSVTNTGTQKGKFAAQLYVQTPYTQYDKINLVEKSAIDFIGMAKTGVLEPGQKEVLTIDVDMKYFASYDYKTAKTYIMDGGEYYFAVGKGAHDAVNNILAAQGKTTSDGMDYNGNGNCVRTYTIGTAGQVDAVSFSKSENGTAITNQLDNADINYYKPGEVTYLTRSDWDGTFPKTYSGIKIEGAKTEEWLKHLRNDVYDVRTDGGNLTYGANNGLKFTDLVGADLDDERWDKLVDQIPMDVLYAKILKGGSQSDIIEEIANPVISQNDGPNGFSSALGGKNANKTQADQPYYIPDTDPNKDFKMNTLPSMPVMAATFNKELINEAGNIMGNDGLWSGNYIIWGTTANLHRTPYNGRNHEYFSEDAMLTNYMATEMVKGAQAKGIIVGPKHLAFNDQECNRTGVAPYMTEQKARETEMRAFQGGYEEAGALGCMTSFSRIGATAVNGHIGLLQNILRKEWGFKGVLSTDMMNNAAYFRPEMCVMAGITMIADFSQNEKLSDVTKTWKYVTEDWLKKDDAMGAAAKQNMKWQLYAFVNSAAQNAFTIEVMPWWEATLIAAIVVFSVIAAAAVAMYAITVVRGKKEVD